MRRHLPIAPKNTEEAIASRRASGTRAEAAPCVPHRPVGASAPSRAEDDLLSLDLLLVEQVEATRRQRHRARTGVRLDGQHQRRVLLVADAPRSRGRCRAYLPARRRHRNRHAARRVGARSHPGVPGDPGVADLWRPDPLDDPLLAAVDVHDDQLRSTGQIRILPRKGNAGPALAEVGDPRPVR